MDRCPDESDPHSPAAVPIHEGATIMPFLSVEPTPKDAGEEKVNAT